MRRASSPPINLDVGCARLYRKAMSKPQAKIAVTMAREWVIRRPYVLCGSSIHSTDLAKAFSTDPGFRINDPTSFGCAIAQAIPGFRAGREGACVYVDRKTVNRRAGKLDLESMKTYPGKKELDMGKMLSAVSGMAGDDLFFLKSTKYQHQFEYRLLWSVGGELDDFIEVKSQDAVQFCTRFEEIDQ